jgi:hypothetical protein
MGHVHIASGKFAVPPLVTLTLIFRLVGLHAEAEQSA